MAPKKKTAAGKGRKRQHVGILGQPLYDSDEDEDWMPKKSPIASPKGRSRRAEAATAESDESSSSDSASGYLDEPLSKRGVRRRLEAGSQAALPQNTKRPRSTRGRQARDLATPASNPIPKSPPPGRSEAPRGRRKVVAGAGASEAAVAVQPRVDPGARDWGALTAPLLVEVLRRACASSSLPTACAAPCVCRHWRTVCQDLEDQAVKAAEAATAGLTAILAAEAQAAAMAADAAAAAAAVHWRPEAAVADRGPGGGAAAAEAASNPAACGAGVGTVEAAMGSEAADEGRGVDEGGTRGLWSCLDVRSTPSARLTDRVVAQGSDSRRWMQVRTLRLGASSPTGLTPDGLAALAAGCPTLTALEMTQCDSLIKPDTMRPVLASLPALRLLDISHCAARNLDAIVRMALAPRPAAAAEQQQQQQRRRRGAGSGAGGDRGGGAGGAGAAAGGGGDEALPCPLRVLRLRGCTGLRAGVALAPDVTHVTLIPRHALVDGAAAAPVSVPLLVHLTELDLTGSGAVTSWEELAIEKLQAAAPNLRVLRLGATGSAVYGKGLDLALEPRRPGPGFPQLRICELGLSRLAWNGKSLQRPSSTLDLLRRVVGASPRLHSLDVSGAMSRQDLSVLMDLAVAARDGVPYAALLEEDEEDGHAPGFQPAMPQAHEHEPFHGGNDVELWAAAARSQARREMRTAALEAEAEATAAALAAVASLGLLPGGRLPMSAGCKLSAQLKQSLGYQLWCALPDGPLRVLRASRSLLASDAALRAIAHRFGRTLQVIDVSDSTQVTDAGLLHVAHNCTALTSLDVSGTAITDWGVKCLLAFRCTGVGAGGGAAGGLAQGNVGAADTSRTAAKEAGKGQKVARGSGGGRSAPAVIEVVSDSDDDGQGDGEGIAGAGRGRRGLLHLDINSCRGVDRATRHAAAEGLVALRRLLQV